MVAEVSQTCWYRSFARSLIRAAARCSRRAIPAFEDTQDPQTGAAKLGWVHEKADGQHFAWDHDQDKQVQTRAQFKKKLQRLRQLFNKPPISQLAAALKFSTAQHVISTDIRGHAHCQRMAWAPSHQPSCNKQADDTESQSSHPAPGA